MKVNFYLRFFKGIAGGYKVIYQYANYLAQKGHDVVIYYDLADGINTKHIPRKIKIFLSRKYLKRYPYYFKLDTRIRQYGIKEIANSYVRDADISVFTSPVTAYATDKLSTSKGKSVYFIQAYENWWNDEAYLLNSYSKCDNNIVISKWLQEVVDKHAKSQSIIINNGIDLNKFCIKINTDMRNKHSIAMIYHEDELKGCQYGIEALKELKKEFSDLEVNMFGNPKRPADLPKWIHYTQKANEEQVIQILNHSSIFMCTSIHEGFGLPGLEAMACGCVLITTKCLGPLEYANETNSVLCEIKDSKSLYKAAKKIFDDEEFKNRILNGAKVSMKQWNIKFSSSLFEDTLVKIVGKEENEK